MDQLIPYIVSMEIQSKNQSILTEAIDVIYIQEKFRE